MSIQVGRPAVPRRSPVPTSSIYRRALVAVAVLIGVFGVFPAGASAAATITSVGDTFTLTDAPGAALDYFGMTSGGSGSAALFYIDSRRDDTSLVLGAGCWRNTFEDGTPSDGVQCTGIGVTGVVAMLGDNNDSWHTGPAADITLTVYGGDGDDGLLGRGDVAPFVGNDTMYGDAGNDRLIGWAGADHLYGGAGNDLLSGDNHPEQTNGGNDYLDGGPGDDELDGDDADDELRGGPGLNSLTGGKGNDVLLGGPDHDEVYGGPGTDDLRGGADGDFLHSRDSEADTVRCGGGIDLVLADKLDRFPDRDCEFVKMPGEDPCPNLYTHSDHWTPYPAIVDARGNCFGGSGSDTMTGDNGPDYIASGAGNDKLFGKGGNDSLQGQAGADRIDGGPGRDKMYGGPGGDRINARDGKPGDLLNCGPGRDVALINRGDTTRGCEVIKVG